jgi:bifunctional UDP-N-acetylglucosamine pyrophosphorylase/glucosamine-1-phosphate N-acetyltransferase
MLDHVVKAARAGGADRIAVVVGAGAEQVSLHVGGRHPDAAVHVQAERLGTAHAVLAARSSLVDRADHVIVLFGDTPLVRPDTIAQARARLSAGADVVVVGFDAADPTGYGRLVMDGDRVVAIVEERDADPDTRRIRLCNGGIMAFRGALLPELLEAISNANAKGEFYLTDAVAIAAGQGLSTAVFSVAEEDVMGVNDRVQLAGAEAVFQARARQAAMLGGATLLAPDTVTFSHDTIVGRDVLIEPNVVFGPGVTLDDGAVVRSFCHLEAARVGPGAIIGPFARLRPGADIGPHAHVGNFCEIKNASLGDGTKVNHLSYIGDATVGAKTNVGAGTITCNYDGTFKHRTVIGSGVFVGSHTTFVAPVSVGDGGYTAAGSVVTEDVPADAVAFARSRQSNKEGHARRLREALAAKKAALGKRAD